MTLQDIRFCIELLLVEYALFDVFEIDFGDIVVIAVSFCWMWLSLFGTDFSFPVLELSNSSLISVKHLPLLCGAFQLMKSLENSVKMQWAYAVLIQLQTQSILGVKLISH